MKNSRRKNQTESSMDENLMNGMSNKTGQIIAAAVIGAAAGAVAGILLAPSSGRETLDNMSRKANSWKNNLNDSVKEYASMGKEKFENMVGSEAHGGNNTNKSANGSTSNNNQKSSKATNSNI